MNSDELKQALFSGCPVEFDGIEYKCVSAIKYSRLNNKIIMQAELQDKNNNCIVIARPSRVNFINPLSDVKKAICESIFTNAVYS